MYPTLLAEALRDRGYDPVALLESSGGPGMSDDQVIDLAIAQQRCLLTENVKDFETIRLQRQYDRRLCCGLLYSSPQRFPRSKSGIGRLIFAVGELLDAEDLPTSGQVGWL